MNSVHKSRPEFTTKCNFPNTLQTDIKQLSDSKVVLGPCETVMDLIWLLGW